MAQGYKLSKKVTKDISVTLYFSCYNIDIPINLKSNIKIDKLDLPTFYWLPKLHKNPYKSRFISNSSHCSTTILS